MATWTKDVRPMVLTDQGRAYHNEGRPTPVIPETRPDVRPSCLNKTGDEIGE